MSSVFHRYLSIFSQCIYTRFGLHLTRDSSPVLTAVLGYYSSHILKPSPAQRTPSQDLNRLIVERWKQRSHIKETSRYTAKLETVLPLAHFPAHFPAHRPLSLRRRYYLLLPPTKNLYLTSLPASLHIHIASQPLPAPIQLPSRHEPSSRQPRRFICTTHSPLPSHTKLHSSSHKRSDFEEGTWERSTMNDRFSIRSFVSVNQHGFGKPLKSRNV
nr:hypothetical protein L204_03791 [Cryptococcus depauperatus CBS 7855]